MDLQVEEGLPKMLGASLADKIRETLMKTERYLIIDRGNIEVIMKEIAQGQSGCFEASCAVEAGRLLSAQFIVTGRLAKLGPNQCQLSVQMTDVARAEILKVASDTSACEGAALTTAAENVAMDLMGIPRQPGKVVIASRPSGAMVYIDGERVGQTPFNTALKPGKHKIMIIAKKFKPEEQTISVQPGGSNNIQVTLKKEKKKLYARWWFITIVAALVVGGGAAAAMGSKSGSGGDNNGGGSNTGNIPVSW